MIGKQVKSIMIGSVLVIGGILYFGKNRRKKLLYQAISDTIDDRGGTYHGGGNAFDAGAETSGCTLSAYKSKRIAERVYSSLYDQGLFGWGTDENELFSTLRSIPNLRCLAKVSQAYDTEYNRNMDANIRNDLKDTPTYLDEYSKIISQEIPV